MGLVETNMYVPNQVNYRNEMYSNWVHTNFRETIRLNMQIRSILYLPYK